MEFLIVIFFFIASVVFTHIYKKIAIDYKILAIKNHRTLHSLPTPRGGGFIFSILSISAFGLISWHQHLTEGLLLALLVGGLIATLTGFIDDLKDLSTKVKLNIQLILAFWLLYCQYYDESMLFDLLPVYIIVPIALFFMVWMMNAFNFMDGIDGMLASGTIFGSLVLALVMFLTQGPIEIIAIFILIAATVAGFILFNWPPATIFMGDAGSLFLGYIFCVLLFFTSMNNIISIWTWFTVFGIFFTDTAVTQVMRILLVKRWYMAHRSHAYQNIARITESHLKVTGGVLLFNLLWVLPLAVWSALQPEMGMIALILSISPALVVAYKYGPIFSSS